MIKEKEIKIKDLKDGRTDLEEPLPPTPAEVIREIREDVVTRATSVQVMRGTREANELAIRETREANVLAVRKTREAGAQAIRGIREI